ncbi:MAG: UDP-N-acetylmuramoyl-L-alanine--D-glutamate ligase, partial [Anaerolineae bacterium]|nr:UDP-N-acetylmuramoyl-L-alanine--D-glutamate ligase [Anaerolineae bacterium]
PLIASISDMQATDLAVMELSSFQLEIMTTSPHIAAVLNITPNHLDRHAGMQAYTAAKAKILAFQGPSGIAVLNRDDPGSWALAGQVHGHLHSFGLGEPEPGQLGAFIRDRSLWLRTPTGDDEVVPLHNIKLRGEHNLLNVLAACAIAAAAAIPIAAMRTAIAGFESVPHRLEFVRHWGGADWYNDSIATAPERAIASMRAFQAPLVLLAGGRDKHLPWDQFAAVVRQQVDHLIVFGEAADIILSAVRALPDLPPAFTVDRFSTLQQAVQKAAAVVQPGDVVLLAPGGTSFDEFEDFEQRGAKFKEWVLAL